MQQLRAPAAYRNDRLKSLSIVHEFHVASIFAAKVQIHLNSPDRVEKLLKRTIRYSDNRYYVRYRVATFQHRKIGIPET